LTATEQRVADLIAGGPTNRDAASSRFISVRIVETHVAAIYRKLGVRNRTEWRDESLGEARIRDFAE